MNSNPGLTHLQFLRQRTMSTENRAATIANTKREARRYSNNHRRSHNFDAMSDLHDPDESSSDEDDHDHGSSGGIGRSLSLFDEADDDDDGSSSDDDDDCDYDCDYDDYDCAENQSRSKKSMKKSMTMAMDKQGARTPLASLSNVLLGSCTPGSAAPHLSPFTFTATSKEMTQINSKHHHNHHHPTKLSRTKSSATERTTTGEMDCHSMAPSMVSVPLTTVSVQRNQHSQSMNRSRTATTELNVSDNASATHSTASAASHNSHNSYTSLISGASDNNKPDRVKRRRTLAARKASWHDVYRQGARFKNLLESTAQRVGVVPQNQSTDNHRKTTQIARLQQELHIAASKTQAAQVAHAELKSTAAVTKAKLANATHALRLAHRARDEAEVHTLTYSTQLEALQLVVDETKRASQVLYEEHQEITCNARVVEQRVVRMQAALERSQQQREQLAQQNVRLQDETAQLQATNRRLDAQLQQAQADSDRWQRSYHEERAAHLERVEQLETVQAQLVQASRVVEQTQRNNAQLQDQVDTLQQTNAALHRQIQGQCGMITPPRKPVIPPLPSSSGPKKCDIRCSICFQSDRDGMPFRCCECGNPECTHKAHVACIRTISIAPSVSHPCTPAPALPVVLCGHTLDRILQKRRERSE